MSEPLSCLLIDTFVIRQGTVYLYSAALPAGRQGHRYKVLGFPLDVPVNIRKVLVRCLSGPDEGLLFTVTPYNFARRYKLEETVADAKEPVSP